MSYARQGLAFPPLTPAIKHLMLANAAVFVLNALLLGRLSDPAGDSSGYWFAFSWAALGDGYGLGLLRLVSYQFTHSFGDPMHFVMNMIVLYFFGTMAEQRLGYRGTCKLYLIGGAVGAALHLMIAATQGYADVPLVGASGACYAFLVYAATMSPNSQVIFIVVQLPIWVLAAVLVGLGAYHAFVEFASGYGSGVSHGAHLGGALLGFCACRMGWFVDLGERHEGTGPFERIMQLRRARRREREVARAAQKAHRLDEILAKVKQQGIGALSTAERRFLEQASRETRQGPGAR
ncbi:MAG: rhomboid family intramembrane serine protease [Planctomycetes bacterium]|nr:rhomboid family intramembrane serine protease [Planctomycetota bacterium]